MRYWRAFARRVENHRLVMDVGLLVIVRGLAWFDGGAVAALVAEIVSGGVVAASARRWVHRRVPRSRADEAYGRVLLRWSFARERLTVAADEPAAHAETVATPIAVLLAFAAILTVMDFLPSAPPTGALPLVRGAGVIASASGGDSIQASLPGRFRYMAVEGPAGVTREQFLAAEVHFLCARWDGATCSQTCLSLSRECPSPLRSQPPAPMSNSTRPMAACTPAMSAAANQLDASQQLSGSPLSGSATVDRALANHRPTLIILLGTGRHT